MVGDFAVLGVVDALCLNFFADASACEAARDHPHDERCRRRTSTTVTATPMACAVTCANDAGIDGDAAGCVVDDAGAAEGWVDDDAGADGADDAANAVDAEDIEAVIVFEPGS